MENTELNTQKGLQCLYVFYHNKLKKKNRKGQSLPQLQVWDLSPGQEKAPCLRTQGHRATARLGRTGGPLAPSGTCFPGNAEDKFHTWLQGLSRAPWRANGHELYKELLMPVDHTGWIPTAPTGPSSNQPKSSGNDEKEGWEMLPWVSLTLFLTHLWDHNRRKMEREEKEQVERQVPLPTKPLELLL